MFDEFYKKSHKSKKTVSKEEKERLLKKREELLDSLNELSITLSYIQRRIDENMERKAIQIEKFSKAIEQTREELGKVDKILLDA